MSIKIKLPKQTSILSFPENISTLESIDPNGYFLYTFEYNVDIYNSSFENKDNSPNIVDIEILDSVKTEKTVKMLSDSESNDQVISNILNHSSRQKDYTINSQDILYTQKSDFTKKIPNDLIKDINDYFKRKSESVKKPVLSKKQTTKTVTVGELRATNGSAPSLNVNKSINSTSQNKKEEPGLYSNRRIERERRESVYKHGIDPATMFGTKTSSIIPTSKSTAGLSTNKHDIRNRPKSAAQIFMEQQRKTLDKDDKAKLVYNKSNPSPQKKFMLMMNNQHAEEKRQKVLKSLGMVNDKDLSNIDNMDANKSISIPFTEESTLLEMKEYVLLPISTIGYSNFTVRFTIRTKKGVLLQQEEFLVEHEKKIADRVIPAIPPNMSVFSEKNGKVILQLKQNDDYASQVFLYRKVYSLDVPVTDAKYELVKSYELTNHQQSIFVEDNIASINPIIYRAIPANDEGILGGEFASITLNKQKSKTSQKRSLLRRPSFVCMTYENLQSKIEIKVDSIPVECIGVQVLKRELTLHEQTYAPITEVILLTHGKESSVKVYDSSVKDDRIYDYCTKLIYEDGYTTIANNNIIVDFKKLEKNILNLNISPLSVRVNNSIIDVNFRIDKEINLTDTDYIKQVLTEQGLYELYQTDITDNKDKLQNLFFLRVIRTNMVTGEEEDFGIIPSADFSDVDFSKVKNVKPLQQGVKYRYAIYAHARSAESLLSTIETTVTNKNGTEYTYKQSKFKHPYTLKHGTLVSKSSLTRNHAQTDFTLGNVVDIKYVEVDLSTFKTSINKIVTNKLTNNMNLLLWNVNGDPDAIDHFIVTLDMLGNKTVVGKCHNISNTTQFQFIDVLTNGEAGTLVYGVTPIYYDYSTGTEYLSNPIVI